MSEGKLAAQVAHVSKELGRMAESNPREDVIVVLGLSATKFKKLLTNLEIISILGIRVIMV